MKDPVQAQNVRIRTSEAVTIRRQGSSYDQAADIPKGIEPSQNLRVKTGAYVRTYDLGRYREMKILYRHKAREEANKMCGFDPG
jgi:choline dehydrogenase-like flavoprotein